MRILLPTMRDVGQVGGTTTHLDMLSRGLSAIGHDAHVLYLGAHVPSAVRNLGIVWPAGALNRVRRGWGMMYAAWTRAQVLARLTERELARDRRAVAAQSPEGIPWQVLNAQDVYSVPGLRTVADTYGIPLVLTLHGYPLYESVSEGYTTQSAWGESYLVRSELRALRQADRIVTVDTRLRDFALNLVPEKASAVTALMNFIDTSSFFPSREGSEELRGRWEIPEGKTVLFCPRRLVKKNGVVYPALALAAMLPEERERFVLLHAGEGGERAAIEEVVGRYGLEAQVRLLGNQDRSAISELYRLCDMVLVPSVHSENVEEATSLAALEAMASGRPLIAGAVGGLAEMVRHEENGLLVPGGDAEALAAAILRLAAAPGLGEGLAEAAREYVVANHSHLKAAERFVEIYEDAAAGISPDLVPYRHWGQARRGAATTATAGAGPAAGAEAVTAGPGVPGVAATAWSTAADVSPPRIEVLGLPLELVSLEEAANWVMNAARSDPPNKEARLAVSFNPELAVRAQRDPVAAEAMLEADLRYPDGVGAVWAAGQQGVSGLERVPGIELAERVLTRAAEEGLSVYFLGAAPGIAEEAARRQAEANPGLRVAGTHHGYFSTDDELEVVDQVRAAGAHILLVAMGAPKQEAFMVRHRAALGVRVALGIGGSFDVWSGAVRRAPAWTRRCNVEWLWRLVSNPRRAGRQVALAKFVRYVMRNAEYEQGRSTRSR